MLWHYHSFIFLKERLYNFLCGSRSMLLLISFILYIRLNRWGRRGILRPSRIQLVHRWLSTLCSYLSGLPVQYQPSPHPRNGPWYCYERAAWNQEEGKGIWPALSTLAKSSSWRLRQTVWFLFEHWWWHGSRSPPVSSSTDLCGGHAGKG